MAPPGDSDFPVDCARVGHVAIRVLVADDEPGIRALFRTMLELEEGFEVVGEAADVDEALALAEREDPDAVILDLGMPSLDGLRAIPTLHELCPRTKIVVVTALPAERGQDRARAGGASAYLEKPSAVDSLARVLTQLAT